MSRCLEIVHSALTTGLLAVCLAGCSPSEQSSHAEKTQAGQTNAVALPSLLSAENPSEDSINDLKVKAEKGDISAQIVLGFKYLEG